MRTSPYSWLGMARIVWALGWSDFVLKYRGSMLGFLWSLIVPLSKFLVIYHVFRPLVNVQQYHLYLFLGIILWEHFSLTTSACMEMLHQKAAIIQKVALPRILLVLAVGWLHVIILCSYILIFLIVALMLGAPVWNGLIYIPFLFIQATCIALGVGMVLSAYSLRFRDIQHLWTVLLQILFWLTPVVYFFSPQRPIGHDLLRTLSSTPSSVWELLDIAIRFQPVSVLLYDARRALLYSESWGLPSIEHVAIFTVACLLFFLASGLVFHRRSRYFVQEY